MYSSSNGIFCIGSLVLASLLFVTAESGAEKTQVDVRVLAKGAKFIGTSMGGAEVQIREVGTDQLLAHGKTVGTTGDTAKIMRESNPHHAPIATPDAAVFHATLELDAPTQIEVEARGPLAQSQAAAIATTTFWVIPGKDLTGGNGVLLELPGFVVDILTPAAHSTMTGAHDTVPFEASVTMMCGCPIEPGGLWDANDFEIVALVTHNESMEHWPVTLEYAGQPNHFEGNIEVIAPGIYDITVYAYDPANGNTGLDRTTFMVRE